MTTTQTHRTAAEIKAEHLAWSRRHTHPADCPCADCNDFFAPLDDEPFDVDPAETVSDQQDWATGRQYATTRRGQFSDGPSEKQVAFIARLAAEKGVDVPQVASKRAASAAIERLLALPTPQAPAADGPALGGVTGRFVKIGDAWCVKVSGSAAPGETVTVRKANGDEKIVRLGVSVAPFTYTIAADPKPADDLPAVPHGHYAIESTGHNDLAFYRVDRLDDGRVFVKMIVGGHPEQNVRRDAVVGILARIVDAGIVESAALYGRSIGRCCRCNRTLTDETSRAAGIGPECATKGW